MQRTILIIDDDQPLTEAMAEGLREQKFHVICAENSEEGLLMAQMHRPDVILCDVVLPDAAGFDTVNSLRTHPATCDVPVILTTGYPYVCKFEGDNQCMTLLKPFSMQTLLDVVKGAVSARAKALNAVR